MDIRRTINYYNCTDQNGDFLRIRKADKNIHLRIEGIFLNFPGRNGWRFDCGPHCKIVCGDYCTIDATENSEIYCGDHCKIYIGVESIFKVGVGCIINGVYGRQMETCFYVPANRKFKFDLAVYAQERRFPTYETDIHFSPRYEFLEGETDAQTIEGG